MKHLKKIFAVIMALAMIFALSMTAFAATTVSTTEDTSVLTLTSTGNTVTYQAVTVDGGWKDNEYYPTTTVYNYTVKTNSDNATISFTNPNSYTVYLDGSVLNSTSFTRSVNSHHTLVLTNNDDFTREFDVAIVGTDTVHVSIEINCYNANNWLKSNTSTTVSTAMNALTQHLGLNTIGKMSSVVTFDLPAGSTAMDALYALMDLKGLTLNGTGSTTGTLDDYPTIYTYISAIDGLGESMCGGWSGWCYVKADNNANNYTMPMYGAASYTLTEGEHIIWVYTCTYTDIGTAINATT